MTPPIDIEAIRARLDADEDAGLLSSDDRVDLRAALDEIERLRKLEAVARRYRDAIAIEQRGGSTWCIVHNYDDLHASRDELDKLLPPVKP